MGIDFIVFAFAAMDRLHVEGMAQDEGDIFLGAEISKPIPDEHAFDRDDDIFLVGGNGMEEGFWRGFSVAVEDGFAGLIENTDIHGPSVQIDSTIVFVLFRVELHIGLLS